MRNGDVLKGSRIGGGQEVSKQRTMDASDGCRPDRRCLAIDWVAITAARDGFSFSPSFASFCLV